MQGCLQLMCNLDYTRNRRRDLTMRCLFIHSFKLRNYSDFKESLHCRAARIIFNFSLDMPSAEVLNKAKWDSIFYMYKLGLA